MSHTPVHAPSIPQPFPASLLPTESSHPSASPSVARTAAGLAHDTRNMLAAMDIYYELLAAPGVLQREHHHFLDELKLLRDSSGSLLDRLLTQAIKCMSAEEQAKRTHQPGPVSPASSATMPAPSSTGPAGPMPAAAQPPKKLVSDLKAELRAALPMLDALAGPRVQVTVAADDCLPAELTIPSLDLVRVLINLVRNAAEAIKTSGRIAIAARPLRDAARPAYLITIEDNGPGIPLSQLDRIFDQQLPASEEDVPGKPRMSFRPRGLGLRIVRDFIRDCGGTIRAMRLPERGSRFEIVLPMVTKVRSACENIPTSGNLLA